MSGDAKVAGSVDALYRLPLGEFIGARNALAKRLRKEKDAAAADAVKALVKPSASAWVVNQLYWSHRDDFDRLMAVGERMRADQQRGLQGGRSSELQAATTERSEALTGLLRRAELVLARDGRSAAPATLKRVETTLKAIATLGGAGPDAQLGRLSSDLEPPGFDALLALAAAEPLAAPPPLPPTPKQATPAGEGVRSIRQARERKNKKGAQASRGPTPAGSDPEDDRRAPREAQAAVASAVERLERCQSDAAEAEAARAAAAARVRQTVAEVSRVQRELRQAEKHAERADVNLERAAARKEKADHEVALARDKLADARAAAEKARGS